MNKARRVSVFLLFAFSFVVLAQATASRDLSAIEQQVIQLEQQARDLGAEVENLVINPKIEPVFLTERIELLRANARLAAADLRGFHWTEADPLLDRIGRIEKQIGQAERRLKDRLEAALAPAPQPIVAVPLATGGQIAGKVTATATGLPVPYLRVSATLPGTYSGASGTTDASGGYRITGLSAGNYLVITDYLYPSHFATETYKDLHCETNCTNATRVPVVDGFVTQGIDFSLEELGRISGTVIDVQTQAPIAGVQVVARGTAGSNYSDDSNQDGTFTIDRLAPGAYKVFARDTRYVAQLYPALPLPDQNDLSAGADVLVGYDEHRQGVDFALTIAGNISGRVVDAASGAGLSDIRVYALDSGGEAVRSVQADYLGYYQINGLADGDYFVKADPYNTYADQAYRDVDCGQNGCDLDSAVAVHAEQGSMTTGIDFSLVKLGGIRGRVSDAVTGFPVAGDVRIYGSTGTYAGSPYIYDTGDYLASGLQPGSFFVKAEGDSAIDEVYDDVVCEAQCDPTTGDEVPVELNEVTPGIDFVLERSGSISGTVRSKETGDPIGSVWVTAYDLSGHEAGQDYTESSGEYRIEDLADGQYRLIARSSGYVTIRYDGQVCPGNCACPADCDLDKGTPVGVSRGSLTTGIDFELTKYGRLSGTVRTDQSNPVTSTLRLYDEDRQLVQTIRNANWLSAGVAPGTYILVASADGHVEETYNDHPCDPRQVASPRFDLVTIAPGQTKTVDITLLPRLFSDVPCDYWAGPWIQALYNSGITSGCASARFCPTSGVTRAQLAVLLLKAAEGSTYSPPPATGVFNDVPSSSPFAPWIEEFSRRGITAGCGPLAYCPDQLVTREQLAVFLLKVLESGSYQPPLLTSLFQDMLGSPFAPWAEELVRRGISAGCSSAPALFCPGATLGRDQLAVMLVKAFNLPLAGF